MSEIKALLELNVTSIVMGIFIMLLALQKILEICNYFLEKFGLETKSVRKKKEQEIKMTEHEKHLRKIDQTLESLRIANMAALADRIDQRYKSFLHLKGIPKDEFDEFVQMHDAYKGVGGNHTIDEKFKKAMKLPILSLEELMHKELQ